MNYLSLFRMPTPMKITGRSSSITNAFINSIIPVIPPTEEQVKQALSILGMSLDTFQCAYCGGQASEWDHLRPLVKDKKPTGYISEIHNLVPACGKCNQSKGNQLWRKWLFGTAKLSPSTRGVPDLESRAQRLEAYERWCEPTILDFEAIVGKTIWAEHWDNWGQVQQTMKQAQRLAEKINTMVADAYKQQKR